MRRKACAILLALALCLEQCMVFAAGGAEFPAPDKTTSKKWEECSKCRGKGTVDCRYCDGDRRVKCTHCGGSGWVN